MKCNGVHRLLQKRGCVFFRVVLLTRKEGRPIPGGSVKIEQLLPCTGKRTLLYAGLTDEGGTMKATAAVPDLPEGEYRLHVLAKSRRAPIR
jgi:hypothetical protein